MAKKNVLAATKTTGSIVWAERKPVCPNPGPAGNRETMLKSSRIPARAAVGSGGHSRWASAITLNQIKGSTITRWCVQVTEESKGISGMKAAPRDSAVCRRVCHHHQPIKMAAAAMRSIETHGNATQGWVYGLAFSVRSSTPASDWLA